MLQHPSGNRYANSVNQGSSHQLSLHSSSNSTDSALKPNLTQTIYERKYNVTKSKYKTNISKFFQIKLVCQLIHSKFTLECYNSLMKKLQLAMCLQILSDLDNSCIDELLNLSHHHRVLHVFLSCLGILLEINQYLQV